MPWWAGLSAAPPPQRESRATMSSSFLRHSAPALLAFLLALAAPPSARAQATAGPVFVTLGTGGGPVIRKERSEPANALVVGDAIYLFDIGAGTQKRLAEAGLDPRRVRAVFLSHLHIDHTADLAPFLINRWVLNDFRPLPVAGPRGTAQTIDGIIRMAGPVALAPVTIGGPAKPGFAGSVAGREFPPDMDRPAIVFEDENIRVLAVTNAHYNYAAGSAEQEYSRSYAFRIEAGGRSWVYTGDTGPSDKLAELARGADVLVSEVIDMDAIGGTLRASGTVPEAMLPALLAHMRHDHLTPRDIGRLARSARVRQVVLTHLVPGNDGETDLSAYSRGIAEFFDGPVMVARDLDRF